MMSEKMMKKIRKILAGEVKLADKHSIKLKDLDYEDEFIDKIVFDEYKKHGEVEGKVFARELKKVLDKFDFTGINFDDFRCVNFNFKGLYGVEINPKKVYNCNFHGAILSGVKFIDNFNDVYIDKTNFTGSIGAKIDPNFLKTNSAHDIVFSDVEFTNPFFLYNHENYAYMSGCDFTGSIGAIIKCNGFHLNLFYCKFTDVKFDGIISDADVSGSNFTGAIDAIIDASKVRSLSNTVLKDVKFINKFDNVYLSGADFTGSSGAIIDPQAVADDFKKTILNDVRIEGLLDGVKLTRSQLDQLKYSKYKVVEQSNDIEHEFKMKVAKLTNKNYIK